MPPLRAAAPWFMAAVWLLVAGCSSEPLVPGDPGAPPADPSGSAGQGGDGWASPPDFTTSDCYGEVHTTSVYDGQTHELSDVRSVCRGETDRVRVYVAEALFGSVVTQAAVNEFLNAYALSGSGRGEHPELAVLSTVEAVFGELDAGRLPGGKLPLVVVDTNGGGDGYLCGWCEELEIHLDGVALEPLDGDTSLAIAAHESFHAIHRGYDADEEPWVDEVLAQATMPVTGLIVDRPALNDFARRPNVSWGPATTAIGDFHYGAGLAYGTWLWERGGEALMRAATAEPRNGWAGLDAALAESGIERTAFESLLDMAVALRLDDPARGYGFRSFDLIAPVAADVLAEAAETAGRVQPYGLIYVELGAGVRSLRLDGDPAVRGLLVADAEPVVLTPVELGVDVPVPSAAPNLVILTAAGETPASYTLTTP